MSILAVQYMSADKLFFSLEGKGRAEQGRRREEERIFRNEIMLLFNY
jgi:hypothetical protein